MHHKFLTEHFLVSYLWFPMHHTHVLECTFPSPWFLMHHKFYNINVPIPGSPPIRYVLELVYYTITGFPSLVL